VLLKTIVAYCFAMSRIILHLFLMPICRPCWRDVGYFLGRFDLRDIPDCKRLL